MKHMKPLNSTKCLSLPQVVVWYKKFSNHPIKAAKNLENESMFNPYKINVDKEKGDSL